MIKNKEDYISGTYKAHKLYKILNIQTLPIKVFKVINAFKNIKVLSYNDFCIMHNITYQEAIEILGSNLGACSWNNVTNCYIIYYNESKGICTYRFTIIHELAHIILKHFTTNNCTYLVAENECNCFARNFLAPLFNKNEYLSGSYLAFLANISLTAAETRMSFLNVDNYNLKEGITQHSFLNNN